MTVMLHQLRQRAITLRRQGLFYSEVAHELQIAKSTAYLWTHAVELDEKQASVIAGRLSASKHAHVKRLALHNQQARIQRDAISEAEASSIIDNIKLTPAHKRLLCAVFFWCEGGKDVSGGLQFINSDPAMMKKFLSLLRESFSVNEAKFRALVHLHDYHDPERQMLYWSSITRIPLTQFHKPYLKPHTGKNTKDGYQGCVSVRYLDASLGKLLKMLYTEYGKKA